MQFMEILRKVSLALGCAAAAVCCLFLNLAGGYALYSNNYETIGICLMLSTGFLILSLIAAFFRKGIFNLTSLILNIIGTLLYIYPISVLNGIPNSTVPRSSIEILTSRIYPAVSVTILLLTAVFADYFSYDRAAKRAEKKMQKQKEQTRKLTDDEKII